MKKRKKQQKNLLKEIINNKFFILIFQDLLLLGISIILFFIGEKLFFRIENDYRDTHGVCIEKYEAARGHRKSSRISSEFILVVREDNGVVFDEEVTPSIFATTNKGGRVSLKRISKYKLGEGDECHGKRDCLLGLMTLFVSFGVFIYFIKFILNFRDKIEELTEKEKYGEEDLYW